MTAITPATLINAAVALGHAADAVARLAKPLSAADRVATLAEVLRRLDEAVDVVANAHTWATTAQAEASKPAPAPAPKPATPPAPPAAPAIPTLAQYAAAMRTKFPAVKDRTDAQFGPSYAGFLASKLGIPAWVGLTPEQRAVWVEKAKPTPAAPAPTADTKPAPAATAAKNPPRQPVARTKADKTAPKSVGLAAYRALVAECKARGLSGKGSAAELTARIEAHKATPPAPKTPAPAAAKAPPAAPKPLGNGTHKALAAKLGVDVASLVDALTDLKLALVTVS